jgi:hypothetical protein
VSEKAKGQAANYTARSSGALPNCRFEIRDPDLK